MKAGDLPHRIDYRNQVSFADGTRATLRQMVELEQRGLVCWPKSSTSIHSPFTLTTNEL